MRSDKIENIAKALIQFQSELVPVKKEADNPFFNSKYADLTGIVESIKTNLAKNKLCITQTIEEGERDSYLETTLIHESGEWISGKQRLVSKKDDMQGIGSAITYARRYGLCAILGIVADEDDDANRATGKDGEKLTLLKAWLKKPHDINKINETAENWAIMQPELTPKDFKEGQDLLQKAIDGAMIHQSNQKYAADTKK